jgi:HK97 family phage major capsid protein
MAPALQSHTFRDDRPRQRLKPRDVLVRAATAELLRRDDRLGSLEPVEDVIQRHYANCTATQFYIRAAVAPASTTTATWAAELVGTAVADFIASDMARQSGFAQLAQRALVVPLDPGVGSVKVPARASPLTLMGAWVAESGPKPVYAGVLSATTITPSKLSAVSAFSEEMMARSEIELIVRETLAHDLSVLLDTAIFDATAASAVRPAGLFNGATAVTASAATPPQEAMLTDLKALAAAVSGTGNPDAQVVFVCNPAQALRINLLAPQYSNLIVSGYVAAGSVGAIDAGSIAMIVGQPVFQLSRDATLHMESVPLALGTGTQGSGVLAVPMRSMFQEDLVALRSVLRTGWAKRRTGCTAIAGSVTW